MRYDKKLIMKKAHEAYRSGRYGTFANCLHLAWVDAKAVAEIRDTYGEVRTWYGWTLVGREVRHDETHVAQIDLLAPKKARGYFATSFFTYEQTVELGTQPKKVA